MFRLGFASLIFICTQVLGQAMDEDAQLLLDMQQSRPQDTFESLLAGETQVPMVVQEAETTISKGVAVILTEAGQGPLYHQGVAPLANELNKVGWVTFSIPAPILKSSQQAPANSQGQADTQVANEQSANMTDPQKPLARFESVKQISEQQIQSQQQQIQLLMRAAASRATDFAGFFMVVSQGASAAWLTKLYSEGRLESPDALVAVGPYWPDRKLNNELASLLANTSMPVLDITSQWDNTWAQQTHEQRRIAARKSLKLHYRQRQLLDVPLAEHQQFAYLAKEIYGWVTHMGW